MIRVLIFIGIVAVVAFGATWMADHPGTVLVTWGGRDVEFSVLVGLIAVLVVALVLAILWAIVRFVLNIPAVLSVASRTKRRNRGLKSLSRGLMAVGSGDASAAQRHAGEAERYLQREPMVMLLKAQAAQLSGDRVEAQRVFAAMLDNPDTRVLGLRGLHMEAMRDGDIEAAYVHASEAQKVATLPWAGQAVLQYRASQHDWEGALTTVERNAAGRLIDRPTANRQRAVLQTAIALDCAEKSADEALRLVREALRVAPTLVPAAVLAGKLLSRRGDLRKAAKIIETAFAATPHPDLASAYIGARQGDSALDRLARAETLARQAPGQPESRLCVARAALDAREFARARSVMSPLVNGEDGNRPTARACLMMADVEEAEHGETGALFEWLQRAARAPHDPAWIADGVMSDTWAPVSPVTGRIDAFVWDTPNEQMTAPEPRRVIQHDGAAEGGTRLPPPLQDLPALSIEQTDRPAAVAPEVITPGPTTLSTLRSDAVTTSHRGLPLAGSPDDQGPFVMGRDSGASRLFRRNRV